MVGLFCMFKKKRKAIYVNFQFSRRGKKPAPASSKGSHTYSQPSHIERNKKKVYKSTIFLTVFHALKLNHEHSCSKCTLFSPKNPLLLSQARSWSQRWPEVKQEPLSSKQVVFRDGFSFKPRTKNIRRRRSIHSTTWPLH